MSICGALSVNLIQYMHPVKVVKCMNNTAWQTPAGIIPIGNTKHYLYDDQINPISIVSKVPDYVEIVKGYSCADSLVNNIVNPDRPICSH